MSDSTMISIIRDLVVKAGLGIIQEKDLDNERGLGELGYGSINYLNLLESIENTFEIMIEPETDLKFLNSVDTIYKFVKHHASRVK
jgi:acyl carrier protein